MSRDRQKDKIAMKYRSHLTSSHSSFSFMSRNLVATDAAESASSRNKTTTRGQSLLSILLFAIIFVGILSALGFGLSKLGNSSNVSQSVAEYMKRLS